MTEKATQVLDATVAFHANDREAATEAVRGMATAEFQTASLVLTEVLLSLVVTATGGTYEQVVAVAREGLPGRVAKMPQVRR
jgi:hypothetical protein